VEGVMAIFTGLICIFCTFVVPETYAPVLLRKRAARLSKLTGKVYKSNVDILQPPKTPVKAFQIALSRPWILLLKEPIVLTMSIYMAIVYGTLYMLFAAFPIVYQQKRGWNEGIGGCAFIGVMVGQLLGLSYALYDNARYKRLNEKYHGFTPPEHRLPVAMIGGVAAPIGLFWFSWTNGPEIHWISSVMAGAPFGFGMVLIFMGIMNYLIDSYTIYAASVLAANSVLRSLFGTAFPLFTTYMYNNLGIHWASSVPSFLALGCVPFPFLFYKYGPTIRKHCPYASKAAAFMAALQDKSEKQRKAAAASEAELQGEKELEKEAAREGEETPANAGDRSRARTPEADSQSSVSRTL